MTSPTAPLRMTTPPELPAPLMKLLDEYRNAIKHAMKMRDGKWSWQDITDADDAQCAARSALESELSGLVADRERLDWQRERENMVCGRDAFPTLDEYRRALDAIRRMTEKAREFRAARALPSTEEDTNG